MVSCLFSFRWVPTCSPPAAFPTVLPPSRALPASTHPDKVRGADSSSCLTLGSKKHLMKCYWGLLLYFFLKFLIGLWCCQVSKRPHMSCLVLISPWEVDESILTGEETETQLWDLPFCIALLWIQNILNFLVPLLMLNRSRKRNPPLSTRLWRLFKIHADFWVPTGQSPESWKQGSHLNPCYKWFG